MGGMRSVLTGFAVGTVIGAGGYLAAAGIYALQNNMHRLQQDHDLAKQIANALEKKEFVGTILPVETNIVIFEVKDKFTPASFVARLKEEGILSYAISPTQVRVVVHLDIDSAKAEKTIETINQL